MCPANICASPVNLMYTVGKKSICPDWMITCPVGHPKTKVYTPSNEIYLPQSRLYVESWFDYARKCLSSIWNPFVKITLQPTYLHNRISYAWKSPSLYELIVAWWYHMASIDQSHRYGRHQAACREPAGSYDKTTRTVISFEHKTQYLLIRAPYTRIVVFWHISNTHPMISQSQSSCNTPTFYITAIFVKYCYTTGSWLL